MTNFEAKRPEVDRETGLPLWAVEVIDAAPNARGKAKSVKVKVAAEACPALSDEVAGLPLWPVEFEGMSVLPYVDDSDRRPQVAYSAARPRPQGPWRSGSSGDQKRRLT